MQKKSLGTAGLRRPRRSRAPSVDAVLWVCGCLGVPALSVCMNECVSGCLGVSRWYGELLTQVFFLASSPSRQHLYTHSNKAQLATVLSPLSHFRISLPLCGLPNYISSSLFAWLIFQLFHRVYMHILHVAFKVFWALEKKKVFSENMCPRWCTFSGSHPSGALTCGIFIVLQQNLVKLQNKLPKCAVTL